MRGKILISLMVGLVVTLWAVTALAQAEEQKDQLYFLEQVVVKPSMVAEYEAHVKEVLDLCNKYKFTYPFHVSNTDDFLYYFLFPVEDFADIENLYKAFGELEEKTGAEQWQAMLKRVEGTFEYYQYSIFHYLPELSYIPEKPRLKAEEANFFFWEFAYIPFGKEKELEGNIKEWVELYKSENIPDGWSTYVGDIGTEMPLYVFLFRAKSAADYYSQSEKTQKLLGEKYQELLAKWFAICKKLEFKTGRFRPELSYTLKEE